MAKDKYKINLSYQAYHEILNDIYRYNFLKSNGTLNKNNFYNTLIRSFYYNLKTKRKILNDFITDNYKNKFKSKNEIVDFSSKVYSKFNELNHSDLDFNYHNYDIYIYPTKSTLDIYDEIETNELQNQSISEFIRNLFHEYLSLSSSKREAMLYKNIYEFIYLQINNKRIITITLLYGNKIKLKPISIMTDSEEMHNYLVGINLSSSTSQLFAVKLCKIVNVARHDEYFKISNEEFIRYKELLSEGPDFIANEKQHAIIKFDKTGMKMYEYCYKDRPSIYAYDEVTGIYKFKTDINKLYLYLLQFGKHVKVIEPISLKEKLNNFHREAIDE